jgi:hypothetical protein
MRLIEEKALKAALNPVRTTTAIQEDVKSRVQRPSRFRFIEEHNGLTWEPLAVGTESYRLLDNRTAVEAIQILSDRHRLGLAPARAFAHKGDGGQFTSALAVGGRTRMVFTSESLRYKVDGDWSDVCPTVAFDNDYAKGLRGKLGTGAWRYVCSNLNLWEGEFASEQTLIHMGAKGKGAFTLEEILAWIEPGFKALQEKMAKDKAVANLLSHATVTAELLKAIVESAPERYRVKISDAAFQSRYAIGGGQDTGWSVLQAAAEVVSHEWTRKGNATWSGQAWMEKTTAALTEGLGIAV